MNVEPLQNQCSVVSDLSGDEDIRVGLNQYFKGYFLDYKIDCIEPLCSNQGFISISSGAQLMSINLQDQLKATNPQQVFQHKEWIVLIDEINIFTGIRMDSTYETSQSETLVDLGVKQVEKIRYAISFKENFGGEEYSYFWAIQGKDPKTGQFVLMIYEVENERS